MNIRTEKELTIQKIFRFKLNSRDLGPVKKLSKKHNGFLGISKDFGTINSKKFWIPANSRVVNYKLNRLLNSGTGS
jgi:hypothetical protein